MGLGLGAVKITKFALFTLHAVAHWTCCCAFHAAAFLFETEMFLKQPAVVCLLLASSPMHACPLPRLLEEYIKELAAGDNAGKVMAGGGSKKTKLLASSLFTVQSSYQLPQASCSVRADRSIYSHQASLLEDPSLEE
eukprot:scaffold11002_cov61-Skeletonema_dohrnii-CCMP3373.AAC.2